jgi:tRNA modification GTPase
MSQSWNFDAKDSYICRISDLKMIRTGETICAPATAIGGAISIIRISGIQSIEICSKIFFPADRTIKLVNQKGFTIVFGDIRSGDKIIDEVLVSIF